MSADAVVAVKARTQAAPRAAVRTFIGISFVVAVQ
jgi:hypothetical protein